MTATNEHIAEVVEDYAVRAVTEVDDFAARADLDDRIHAGMDDIA